MKKTSYKVLSFSLFVCLLLLFTAFLINSCKKDNNTKTQIAITDQNIALAKQWYQTTFPATGSNGKLATQSIGSSSHNWSNTFSPYWDKAIQYKIDSLSYIEMPALKKGDMAVSLNNSDPSKFNFSKSGSQTSLIIVNKKGVFYIYAMTILADSGYLRGDYTKVGKNSYRTKEKDFSGLIFFHRLDGTFVNGWRYQNGNVVAPLVQSAATTSVTTVVQSLQKPKVNELAACPTTQITTYWEDCAYYVDDVNYQNPFDCYYYETYALYSSCGGSSSGGGTTSTPPCNPPGGTPPPNGNSISAGNKVIDMIQNPPPPPPGSGGIVDQTNNIGTATTPCPPTTTPVDSLQVVFCGGLTSAEKASVVSTIDAFKREDCTSNFLYNHFTGKTFTFCINGSTQGNVVFDPTNNSFTFSTDYAAQPAFASLLEHEFFHAYQNDTYSGGISSYGKNPNTGVSSVGFVNIEFEQAVFNDIATGNQSAFNLGTQQQQQSYSAWINGLTANGTVYPKLSTGTAAYNQFINTYNSFLSQFNALPNNPYSSTSITLTPQALINLFNSSTPNC